MRICLFSYLFPPSIGGLENVSASLARGWTELGHQVTVVTTTPLNPDDPAFDRQFPYPVMRLAPGRPGRQQWKPVLASCEVLVSNGVSLTYWPAWVMHRVPIVFIHPLFLGIIPNEGNPPLLQLLRRHGRLILRRAIVRRAAGNIYISRMIQQDIGGYPGALIYNPVGPEFRPMPEIEQTADFGFFGRMVLEKGVADLLGALARCRDQGHPFTCDLHGPGPAIATFQQQANELGLGQQVRWRPASRGDDLIRAMNSVAVVVVPSRWAEPMGIVAIEAMACGKPVIGSERGGLGEVLEGVGFTFPNGDVPRLAQTMMQVMADPHLGASRARAGLEHSKAFSLPRVAQQYIDYLETVLKNKRTKRR